MQKICKKCGISKDVSQFYKSKILKDGYENICKECKKTNSYIHIKVCDECGKIFKTSKINQKYCSNKCSIENRNKNNRAIIKCEICGKEVIRKNSSLQDKEHFFCSKKCSMQFIKTNLVNNNKLRTKEKTELICDTCGKKFYKLDSHIDNSEHHYCSRKCKDIGISIYYSGKNHPRWNSNKTEKEREIKREYEEYYEWRRQVFKRDNYTCQCCGDNKGHNLRAHHKRNYSEHKELRTDINNGITLCDKCHKEFHDLYGYKNNDELQFVEFKNKYIALKRIV